MATAKKGKKNKGKTLALVDFLQETPGAIPSMPIRKSSTSWADDVEDSHDMYESRSSKAANVVLPTAPKASRDFDDFIDKVPTSGPFTAYLSNLPYDVEEDEIMYFFKNMKIESLRLPKDDRSGEGPKLKGYGYVEFEDRDSLLNALVIPDTTIKNRRIRIEIASEADNDKRRGGRMDMSRDRGNRGEAPTGDWRSGPRTESSGEGSERRGFGGEGSERRGFGGEGSDRRGFGRDNRDRDNRDDNTSGAWRSGNRDRDMDRDRSDRPFTRSEQRPSSFSRDDRDQDYNRPRGGGGSGRDDDSRFVRRNYGGDRDGGDRDRDRGGDRRNDRMMERSERMMDRSGMMERNGAGGGGGGYSRGPPRSSADDSESTGRSSEPRQRPRLVLAPRSKPVENEPVEKVASSGANIFGNAKPVDTSARERQIEERLAKEHDGPAPRRELSRERRGPSPREEKEITREEKREPEEPEKKPLERTSSSSSQKSETNGVVDKSHQARKNGDQEKREPVKSDEKLHSKADSNKKREEKKDKVEKEMPKLKQVDPPNFSSSNKFAFLETEDTSD